MRQRRSSVIKDANKRIPSNITQEFISDLSLVLTNDESIEAHYLSKFWLSKFCETDPGSAEIRRSAAVTKWLSVEETNRSTNSRIMNGLARDSLIGNHTIDSYLDRARTVIADVLGDCPSLDVRYAAYSGGASTSKRRSEGHPALKFLGKADSTRDTWNKCRHLLDGTRYADHIYAGLEPRFVDGSVLFTVPKNSDIDRVCCKEPDINLYFQKMFGSQIRYCLKRVGIDLNDQSINGNLAREASVTGRLATLDLSAASDSVTKSLVRELLPTSWYFWLNACRSKHIQVDGENHQLEMFSSMGNGFTFELESLIFYGLAKAVVYLNGIRGRVSVYGDDIIIPTDGALPLISLLAYAGFKTNEEKSFIEGPFRESCGSYYHNGINVKPFYMKGPLTRLTDLIKVLNQLTSWASRLGNVVDPRYVAIHNKYKVLIPTILHGGQDCTSITSLVTGDSPRQELRPVVRIRDHHHIGGYLNWLQITSMRQQPSLVEIVNSSFSIYRIKKNAQERTVLPDFLRESSITESGVNRYHVPV